MKINFNKYTLFLFRFGVVERVIIYKEKQSDSVDDDSDTIVKIFVEFTQMIGSNLFKHFRIFLSLLISGDFISEAERARDSLNGRFFGGRLVKAELYDQALFDHSDFSG